MDRNPDIEERIRIEVRRVATYEAHFALLSTDERIAVAFVLDRPELVDEAWGTMLGAIDRLGPQWTRAALNVQRHGW
jgi:hypothetical protein